MSESQRASRTRAKPDRSVATAPSRDTAASGPAFSGPAPQWAASHVPAPFALGGVQRKVAIGPAGDSYEREADRVAADVASGRAVAPSAISPIGSLPTAGAGQRAMAAPEKDKKPDEKPSAIPVQKAAAPAAPPKDDQKNQKKDDRPKPPPVQKAAAPDPKDKQKEPAKEKPKAPVQRAPAGSAAQAPGTPKERDKEKEKDKTTEQKLASAPVQKADAGPAEKKKDDKPSPVQKAAAPEEKKKDDKVKPAPVQKAAAPEEKKKDDKPKPAPVQKAAAPEEKKKDEKPKPLQKAEAPEDTLVRDAEREAEHELKQAPDEQAAPAQRAPATAAPTPSMESAASSAVQGRGAGEPMQSSTRSALESRMGVDLGGVRVHQDRTAHVTSDAIQARAFTHGNDIWLARGESQADVPLMAHEATHVVQQAGGVHRMLVQRAGKGKTGKDAAPTGKVDVAAKTVDIDELHIPKVKGKFPPKAPYIFKTPEPRTSQRQIWRDALDATVQGALPAKLQPLPGVTKGTDGPVEAKKEDANKTYFLQLAAGEGHSSYLIGTATELKDEFVIPRWGPKGNPRPLDVDHKTELQLGGSASSLDNFWLLDASANRSSGAKIANQIRKSVTGAVAPEVGKDKTWKAPPTLEELIDQKYTVTARNITPDLDVVGEPDTIWEADDIKTLKPLDKLKALTVKQAISRNLVGDKNELLIYPLPTGGKPRKVKWNPKEESQTYTDADFLKGFQPSKLNYKIGGGSGSVEGLLFPGKKKKKIAPEPQPITLDLVDLGGLPYTTTIAPGNLRQGMKFAALKGLSPVEFHQVGLEDPGGLVARGKLTTTLPGLKKLDLDVLITGEDVALSKTFTSDDFNLPGPIKVTGASVTVTVSTSELAVSGDVFFEIERVGKGQISGSVGTEGLELKGTFDFDSELFKPAQVTLGYEGGKFKGEGTIGIPDGKVKGIKSASLTVKVEEDKIDATGTVKPSIPGVEQGDLSFSYDPKTGIVIAGKLELKKDIPGIAGGSVSAELAKRPGEERWKVKAAGEATPKIPGVSSTLSVMYDDGAFDAVVTAGYEKGMLKGSITVGATNRPAGEDGKPAGPPPEKGDKVTLYGGGSVTLKIAPWLQATAAIKLLPNGEIEVTGEIGLPSVLDIFPEKKLDKNIFKIGIDIPIVGVAVAGQRIGIFANISGGLDLSAGIGPGQINQLKLAVTYNPAHEENTKVAGDANLHIPAHAGLRLFVRGSLGVGIPIVSASAGLEIGGSLGLEGALDAGVHVEWTPTKGLDLRAQASIYVEPKLKFDVTGFVLVEADLFITTIELYSKKWQLAAFEYGSGLRFGLKFPIHYQEGHPFDISLSDVEFEVPKIDPGELLSGLIKKVA